MLALSYNAVSQASVVSIVRAFANKQCLSQEIEGTALILTYKDRCFRDRSLKMHEIEASHCLIPNLTPANFLLITCLPANDSANNFGITSSEYLQVGWGCRGVRRGERCVRAPLPPPPAEI